MALRGATDLYRKFFRAVARCPTDRDGAWREPDLWAVHAEHADEFRACSIEIFFCAIRDAPEELAADFRSAVPEPVIAWYGVVSEEDVPVRNGASLSSRVVRRLPAGGVVEALEHAEGSWRGEHLTLVRTADGWLADRCPLLHEPVLEELSPEEGWQRKRSKVVAASPVESLMAAQQRRYSGRRDDPRTFDGLWEEAGAADSEVTGIKGNRMRGSNGVVQTIKILGPGHIEAAVDGTAHRGELMPDMSILWSWGGTWVPHDPEDSDLYFPSLSESSRLSNGSPAYGGEGCGGHTKWVTFVDAKGAPGYRPPHALGPPPQKRERSSPTARRVSFRPESEDVPPRTTEPKKARSVDVADEPCSVM